MKTQIMTRRLALVGALAIVAAAAVTTYVLSRPAIPAVSTADKEPAIDRAAVSAPEKFNSESKDNSELSTAAKLGHGIDATSQSSDLHSETQASARKEVGVPIDYSALTALALSQDKNKVIAEVLEMLQEPGLRDDVHSLVRAAAYLASDADASTRGRVREALKTHFRRNDFNENTLQNELYTKVAELSWIGLVADEQTRAELHRAVEGPGVESWIAQWQLRQPDNQNQLFARHHLEGLIQAEAARALALAQDDRAYELTYEKAIERASLAKDDTEVNTWPTLSQALADFDYIADHGVDSYIQLLEAGSEARMGRTYLTYSMRHARKIRKEVGLPSY